MLTPVKGQWQCSGCARRFAFFVTGKKHLVTCKPTIVRALLPKG